MANFHMGGVPMAIPGLSAEGQMSSPMSETCVRPASLLQRPACYPPMPACHVNSQVPRSMWAQPTQVALSNTGGCLYNGQSPPQLPFTSILRPSTQTPFSSSMTWTCQFPSPAYSYPVMNTPGPGSAGPMNSALGQMNGSTSSVSSVGGPSWALPFVVSSGANHVTDNKSAISAPLDSGGARPKVSFAQEGQSSVLSKRSMMQGKRKAKTDRDDVPAKIHVNEDRMAARMQGLNLDNNNLDWHPNLENREEPWLTRRTPARRRNSAGEDNNNNNGFLPLVEMAEVNLNPQQSGHLPTNVAFSDEQFTGYPIDVDSLGSDQSEEESTSGLPATRIGRLPRLQLSDEIKLGLNTTEILPKGILEKIAKPLDRQVVLWKPPTDIIKGVVSNHGTARRQSSLGGRTSRMESDLDRAHARSARLSMCATGCVGAGDELDLGSMDVEAAEMGAAATAGSDIDGAVMLPTSLPPRRNSTGSPSFNLEGRSVARSNSEEPTGLNFGGTDSSGYCSQLKDSMEELWDDTMEL